MTKIGPLTNILVLLVTIVFCAISQCLAALSDKQLCYDPNCSEVISLAKTILAYRTNDHEVMSFGINENVKVFSKGAGTRTDLWGVEIKGKRGFAPKTFLNEYKILQRILSYEVPVYKFTDEIKDKVQTKAERVHKGHPLLKDKLLHDDNETLSPSARSLDKTIQEGNVESKKLESTAEKIDKVHSSIKDNLSHNNDETSLLSAQSVDKTVPEIEALNVDSVLPSYEVIDGTAFYFEDKSAEQDFATEAMHATALPNERALPSVTDSKTNSDNDDGKMLFNGKEIHHDTNDFDTKLEGLSVDTPEKTSTETRLENSEAMISQTVDTLRKPDASSHDTSSTHEPSKNLGNKDRSVDSTEITEEGTVLLEKEEQPTEDIENEGIFASFARKFNILSEKTSLETATTESTTTGTNNDDLSSPQVVDKVVEESVPAVETLSSSIDSSIASKDDTKVQREIVDESNQTTKFSSEEVKSEEETVAVRLEDATPHDVPLSSNFVHEDAYKPTQDSSKAPSVLANNSSAFNGADISSNTENIQTRIAGKDEEKLVEKSIEIEGAIASLEEGPAVSSEITTTSSTGVQSNDDVEQTSHQESDTHALYEDTKKYIRQETIVQVGDAAAAVDGVPAASKLPFSVEDAPESITRETLPDRPVVEEGTVIIHDSLDRDAADIQLDAKSTVHSNVNKNDNLVYDASSGNVPIESNEFSDDVKSSTVGPDQFTDSSRKGMISEEKWAFDEYPRNQNLASVKEDFEHRNVENQIHSTVKGYGDHMSGEDEILPKDEIINEDSEQAQKPKSTLILHEIKDNVCSLDHECTTESIVEDSSKSLRKVEGEEDYVTGVITIDHNYWKILMYLVVTALTTLVFTLGYYYIENIRRDGQLIAKINKLQKELLVSTKECEVLTKDVMTAKEKNKKIMSDITQFTTRLRYLKDDETLGPDEMVEIVEMVGMVGIYETIISLKADLRTSQKSKAELEDQVTMLEKDIESATEAGLELERMLREVLSSNNEVNPLAQSVEDLQARLDAQQAANESLTNALNLKSQEIETLSADLVVAKEKYEELEVELSRIHEELDSQRKLKNNVEKTFTDKIHSFEMQVNELSSEKTSLHKELRGKEIETKELLEIINQINSNNLDLEKLYDVSHVKTEVVQLREERDELKMRLSDVEGAHQLLEEHMKLVKEEVATLSEQCKIAEKEKKDAETRLEVLSNFFKEKEAERQKEEAIWLQKQGEVVSTVERMQTMQNEIQNYKQQTEMLKREIVDQEREYKSQISSLETRSHEQWVLARQNERRMEEMRTEAGQLRNRLTLAEKNLNDSDSETKLHRLEANGDTATSPALFAGAESSSSPVMFNSVVPPPPPPSYLHCFPTHLPPVPPLASGFVRTQYDSLSQRPPPLGGRLSSPPPMPPLHHPPGPGGRYENASSPPPPMSPHLLPPFNRHRSPPPSFGGDHIPPFPPPGSIVPPPIGTAHAWAEESLPLLRSSGFHPHQREQRARNHKGSLHSSGESLDKVHHGKI